MLMMTATSKLSLWIGVLGTCLVSMVMGQNQKDAYHQLFGVQLENVFASQRTLHEAIRQKLLNSYKEEDLYFGCADYAAGSTVAQKQREQAQLGLLTPYLVNREDDLICFLVTQTNATIPYLANQLNRFAFPPALKIHNSLSNVLLNASPIEKMESLEISFRQEFFDSQTNSFNRSVENSVRQTLNIQPETKLMDNFFWISKDTEAFFEDETMDDELAADKENYYKWKKLLSYFEDSNHDYTYADANFLVCNFQSLNNFLQYDAGILKFRIHDYLGLLPNDDKLPCLAVLSVDLISRPIVNHIALLPAVELLNFRARSIPQTATVSSDSFAMPYTKAGLLGDNQIITIADSGVDAFSCYFYDPQGRVPDRDVSSPFYDLKYRKIVQYLHNSCGDSSDATGGHGTHVSGIAVGGISNANIFYDGKYDGVAPNAKLSFSDFGKSGTGLCIPSVTLLYGPGYAAGARVASNSWGSYFSGSGYYSTQNTDSYLYQQQSMSSFFAAGNAGGNGYGDRTITMEGTAKNIVTVGSSETTLGSSSIENVAFYSSKGPTYDNRFKPDLVSPGDSLLSANSAGNGQTSCGTIQMTGTSMATPGAAGIGLLIRQYFMDTSNRFWTSVCNKAYRSCKSFTPSGPLIKAILIQSGRKMQLFDGGGQYDVRLGAPPDFIQGFGRISLFQVLPLSGWLTTFDLFVADAVNIQENSEISYIVQVTSKNTPLKGTLVWYDPPSVQGSTAKALINDLDIFAISPSGQKIFPNKKSSPDTVNTVERLNITSPSVGQWKIVVSAHSLPVMGNQLFSLVITSVGTVSYN